MGRTLVLVAALLTLSLPTALAAPPADKPDNPGKSAAAPGQSGEKAAKRALKQKCRSLRKTDPAAFRTQCAGLKKAKKEKDESASDREGEDNAAKKCKAERASMGLEAFKDKYAPEGHPNGANAFGKCVSKLSKEKTTD